MLLKLIAGELLHRKTSFLLALAAVAAAVAVCIALLMTEEAAQRETRKVMLKMGFNLRIIPKAADIDQFYLSGYTTETMPEESIDRLASAADISYNHLLATLQRRIDLAGGEAILLGISEEKAPPGREKPPMASPVDPSTVQVGYQVAKRLNLKEGDELEIRGESFRIVRVMPQMGTLDDVRVIGTLADVQRVLEAPGQINEIQAMDCLCLTPEENPQAQLQKELSAALPEGQVVMLSRIAEARARQRQLSEQHTAIIVAVVGAGAAIWVAALAVVNVRQRFVEIGVLRALGYHSLFIGTLIAGRAVLIGLIAAGIGYVVGSFAAVYFGREAFPVTGKKIAFDATYLYWSLLAAPLLAMLASLIPTAQAVALDPAEALRRE